MGLLKNIKDGWFNYIKASISRRSLSPEFQEEVNKRAEICSTCPELKLISKKVPGSGPVQGKCNKCGCVFPPLIFAPGKKCPIGKWGKFDQKKP